MEKLSELNTIKSEKRFIFVLKEFNSENVLHSFEAEMRKSIYRRKKIWKE